MKLTDEELKIKEKLLKELTATSETNSNDKKKKNAGIL